MNASGHDKQMKLNFKALFGFRLPHMDTVDDVLKNMDAEELEKLRTSMVRVLLKKKLLRHVRLSNAHYLIAVDATGVAKANATDEGTLAKISKTGKETYMRQVLEAKIIVSGGFSISIATEWLASDLNDNGSKEDSELSGFKRLAAKIIGYYPKLKICILADGLYPSEPFFRICEENNWCYCVVLKDKKLSTVWEQVERELNITEATGQVENMILGDKTTVEWVNNITYREKSIGWIECRENIGEAERRFVFLTDLLIDQTTAQEIINAGRSRWNIEDAFNTQKNRGFSLHHKFSRTSFLATKNYYLAMQIAHMIVQLLEFSQHFRKLADHTKETSKHLWSLIVQALTWVFDQETWAISDRRTQFRFK